MDFAPLPDMARLRGNDVVKCGCSSLGPAKCNGINNRPGFLRSANSEFYGGPAYLFIWMAV